MTPARRENPAVMTFLDPGYGSVFAGPRTDAASMTLDSRMRTEWNVGPARVCDLA